MVTARTAYRLALVGAACLAGLMGVAPVAAAAGPAASPARAATPASALAAPTNLRVTQVTRTTVTFQWDAQAGQPGCTLPIVLYAVYLDGGFLGWTYVGSPVGFVGRLAPGSTHRLAVQGRDNCTGALSPLSAPLVVTTLP